MNPGMHPAVLAVATLTKAGILTAYCWVIGAGLKQGLAALVDKDTYRKTNIYIDCFFSIVLGMCAVTTALFLLGMASCLNVGWTSTTLLALLGLAVLGFRLTNRLASTAQSPDASYIDEYLIGNGVFFICLFILLTWTAITPPGMWDDTSYHLPYAKYYLEQQAIAVQPYLRFPLFPNNGGLLFSLALMYGTEIDAQVIATLPLLWIALGLFGICRYQLQSQWAAYLAVILFSQLGPINESLGYAYVDGFLALYCWATVLALLLWIETSKANISWLVICGACAGVAAGTKLFGGVFAVIVGTVLLADNFKSRAPWIYAISTLLFGLGWYLRSYVISGDPIHPAGGNIFGHFLWNADDLLSQKQEQATHGGSRNPLRLFSILQKADALALFPASFILFQPKSWRRSTALGLACFFLYLVFWITTTQVARYLAPVAGLGVFLSTLFIYQAGFGETILRFKAMGSWHIPKPVFPVFISCFGIFFVYSKFNLLMPQISNWSQGLKARSGYEIMVAANLRSDPERKVLVQVGYENAIYFFDGTVIGDWFGPGRYSSMLDCTKACEILPAPQLAILVQSFNSKLFAVNSKRFKFMPENYAEYFNIEFKSPDGYLLSLKHSQP